MNNPNKKIVDAQQIERVADIIHAQDQAQAQAQDQAQGEGDVKSFLSKISIWRGDITTLKCAAIVNAANEQLLGCFQPSHRCIDNIIHAVAGPRLRSECYHLMSSQQHSEPIGHAKITKGYMLPAEYVIHTVGPNLNERGHNKGQEPTEEECAQLSSCYRSSLDTLVTVSPPPSSTSPSPPLTIAFPCISTGLFGFPQQRAVSCAINTVRTWLEQHPHTNVNVIFNVFTDQDEQLYWEYVSALAGVSVPTISRTITSPELNLATSWLSQADAIVISAAAGFSAAAGLDYTDEKLFARLFPAMAKRGFRCMYQFIGYDDWTPALQWGYFLSQVHHARYTWGKQPVYQTLLNMLNTKKLDYFVHTSNADGLFVQNGFSPSRIYTAQGDYSHLQCLKPCRRDAIWPTLPFIERAKPYIDPNTQECTNPDVIPKCQYCGGPVMMQVRGGDWFLEHSFHSQRAAYREWLQNHISAAHRVLILEIGAGFNTPMVLRWPNERLAAQHANVKLIRINAGKEHAKVPVQIEKDRAIGLCGDANELLTALFSPQK